MVIFRIIFNLFRIVTRMAFGIFWLPIYLITRNLYIILIVGGLVIGYLYLTSDDQSSKPAVNSNPTRMQRNGAGDLVQVASPVRLTENGNSAFANDLYVQMTPQEKAYYSEFFYWAMNTLPSMQTHSWSNLDIGGAMLPLDSFQNNSGATCRHFKETLKVHSVQQHLSGIACQQGDGKSWCKLAPNATPACGLGHSPGFWEGVTGSFGKIF